MRMVGRSLLALLLAGLPAGSQGSTGVITDSRVPIYSEALKGVREALKGDERAYDLAELAPEEIKQRLARDDLDAVIAIGASSVQVAMRAPPQTPVVLVLVPNAEEHAYAKEGRPTRAISLQVPPEPILATLRRLAPGARDLWTIYSERISGSLVERLRGAAEEAGFTFEGKAVLDPAGAASAVGIPPSHVGAFFLLGDPVVRNMAFDRALLRLSFARRFPVVGSSRDDVRSGALFAFQLDAVALGRQSVELARAPHDGRVVVPPTGYHLVLNVTTARNLGLTVAEDVRRSAGEVFGE